jgi:hypothetical protein
MGPESGSGGRCKYYEQVVALRDLCVLSAVSVRAAFEFLPADTAKLKGWMFTRELSGLARLVGQVICVSLGNVRLAKPLPAL